MARTFALILAGGGGTRFWPASSRRLPKHLLPLLPDGRTLLEATLDRLLPWLPTDALRVVTADDQAEAIRKAAGARLGPEGVIAEPAARNTGPALVLGAASLGADDDDVVVVLPSDAWIGDDAAFRSALARAASAAAEHDAIATLGIVPDRPATGYGWLAIGDRIDGGTPELRAVERFREKPDAATAQQWLTEGRSWWNAGIFAFRVGTLRRVLAAVATDLAAAWVPLAAGDRSAYTALRAISFDYAVMERAPRVLSVRGEFGWSDLGEWDAIARVLPAVEGGAGQAAAVAAIDAANNVIWAPGQRVALLGVQDLVVVVTPDGVLVAPRARAQEVRALAERLGG